MVTAACRLIDMGEFTSQAHKLGLEMDLEVSTVSGLSKWQCFETACSRLCISLLFLDTPQPVAASNQASVYKLASSCCAGVAIHLLSSAAAVSCICSRHVHRRRLQTVAAH
jgi:hypothetical protein